MTRFTKYYISNISIGRRGQNKIPKALKSKYKHIIVETIVIYSQRKYWLFSNEFNSTCQLDLIYTRAQVEDNFKVILVQDHLKKFVQLRAMKTKRAEEVAYHCWMALQYLDLRAYYTVTIRKNSLIN